MLTIELPFEIAKIPETYSGILVISDIDKTYLATEIDSLSGLLKTAIETAETKENIPGFSILLRALRRGADAEPKSNPLLFVSASPPQMKKVLLNKMELDGIEHNGIIFKNQFEYVRSGDFKKLREQIGYKLSALLKLKARLPQQSRWLLFGDDSESDAIVYSLFADLMEGGLTLPLLEAILYSLGVFREEVQLIKDSLKEIKSYNNPVDAAFINLISSSSPKYYTRFGPHFFATENTLQAACVLFEKGLIRERAVRSIGREMVLHFDFETHRLLESLLTGVRRGLFQMPTLFHLWPILHDANILPPPKDVLEETSLQKTDVAIFQEALNLEPDLRLKYFKKKYSLEGRFDSDLEG